MKLLVSMFVSCCIPLCAYAVDPETSVLISEFNRMHAYVQNLEPDGEVGGLLYYKDMGGYELLWDIEMNDGHDTISIYVENEDRSNNFNVTWYHTNQLFDGEEIIRRFVGPSAGAWRNDTVDVVTGDYWGSQGAPSPRMSDSHRKIVDDWGIVLFE